MCQKRNRMQMKLISSCSGAFKEFHDTCLVVLWQVNREQFRLQHELLIYWSE